MSADLSLVLNLSQEVPANRRVLAATARVPLDLPPLITGTTYSVEVYGIDGTGAYRPESGATGYLPRCNVSRVKSDGTVEILVAAIPTDFSQIPNGWAFNLPLTTTTLLAALADGADPLVATIEILVTGPDGRTLPWYRHEVVLLSRLWNVGSSTPVPGDPAIVQSQFFRTSVRHFPAVTTLLGGGATALNGQVTLGGVVAANDKFLVYLPVGNRTLFYQAVAGNAGSDTEDHVRAADQPTALYYAKIGEIAAATVTSVAGRTGAVVLTPTDVSLSNVTNDAQVKRTEMAAALGVATLDAAAKLLTSQLPDMAIVDYLGTVASQSAMLALAGQKGDWCIRSDLGTVWVITGANPAIIGGWTQLSYPTAPVTSVAGRTGAVVLTSTDVALASVTNDAQVKRSEVTAFTLSLLATATASAFKALLALVKGDVGLNNVDNTADTAKPVSTAQQAALDLKAPIASPVFTGSVTLPGDPSTALQAATKQYVDNLAAGLDVKPSVVAATTANITLSGAQTIDGIALTSGDRCLVKNQSTPSQNGIYVVAAGAWTRATDADSWTELPGAFCFVERGTQNADTGWVCTVDAGGTLGTTAVTFSQFSGVGLTAPTQTAGDNSTLIANTAYVKTAQDELQGHNAPTAISAAGNTDLPFVARMQRRSFAVTVNAGSGAYLATVTLPAANAAAGAEADAQIAMPASLNPTIELRNLTSGGTLLGTLYGHPTLARTWSARFRFDGTNWTLRQLTPANIRNASEDFVQQSTLARTIKECLYADGTSSNRRCEWTPGSPGAVAATAITIPFEAEIPASNPLANIFLAVFAGTGTSDPISAQVNALSFYISTVGALIVRQNGTTLSDARAFTYTTFLAAYAGQRVRGVLIFANPNTTTAPVIILNGVDITAQFSVSTGGTPPNWMPATLDTTKYLVGYNWAGRIVPHGPIFGALSQAEAIDWIQSGRLPVWCELGNGSLTAIYTSDFSVGSDSWLNNTNVTRTANVDANADGAGLPPSNDWIKFINTLGSAQPVVPQRGSTLVVGRRYRITMDVLAMSGSGISAVTVANTGVGIGAQAAANKFTVAVTAGTLASIAGEFIATSTGFFLAPSLADGSSEINVTNNTGVYLKNVVVRELGPIFKPVIPADGDQLPDAGTNSIVGTLTTGVLPISTIRDWPLRYTLTGTSPAIVFGRVQRKYDLAVTGNTTFSASGYTPDAEIDLFLTGDTVDRTLADPGFVWLEGAPGSIVANKRMQIHLECRGTTAGSVRATYAKEP